MERFHEVTTKRQNVMVKDTKTITTSWYKNTRFSTLLHPEDDEIRWDHIGPNQSSVI